MSTETITDFLVGLGFKVDTSSEKKFTKAIEVATLKAHLMGDAIEGMAKSVVRAFEKVTLATERTAEGFESLFYASQRTGATVSNIKNAAYAASQLGSSADAAGASLENFSQFLKDNPGAEGVLKSLGVNSRVRGKLRDQQTILEEFVKKTGKMPYYLAHQYRQMFGVDENLARAINSPEWEKMAARSKKLYREAGLDPDKAAKDSLALTRSWRDLATSFDIMFSKVESNLFLKLGGGVQSLSDWLAKNSGAISDTLTEIGQDILDFLNDEDVKEGFKSFGQHIEGALKWLISDDGKKAIGDFKDDIEGLASGVNTVAQAFGGWENVLKGLIELWAGGKVLRAVNGLRGLMNGGAALPKGGGTGPSIFSGLGIVGLFAATEGLALQTSPEEDKILDDTAKSSQAIRLKYGDDVLKAARAAYQPWYARTSTLDIEDGNDQQYVDKYLADQKADKSVKKAGKSLGTAAGSELSKDDGSGKKLGEQAGESFLDKVKSFFSISSADAAELPMAPGSVPGSGEVGAVHASGNLAKNQKDAYAAARGSGLSDAAAKALVANMSGEALGDPSNVHWDGSHYAHGIVQWDDVRTARIKQQFGKAPQEMSVGEQTKAAVWEMQKFYPDVWKALQRGGNAAQMIGTLVNDYEKPADKAKAIRQRTAYLNGLQIGGTTPGAKEFGKVVLASDSLKTGKVADSLSTVPAATVLGSQARNSSVTANVGPTTINVNGSGDPAATAEAVSRAQGRVHGHLLRNVQGAAQ